MGLPSPLGYSISRARRCWGTVAISRSFCFKTLADPSVTWVIVISLPVFYQIQDRRVARLDVQRQPAWNAISHSAAFK